MLQSKPILSQDIWCSDRDIVASTSRRDAALHYERARSIFRHSGLSQQDIENLTPKFWNFQFDCNGVIAARDMTAFIIVAIQVNLCIGTLCSFVRGRPDLQDLVDKLLNFDICGGFMLTEANHGLDARNLETTATLLPDGSYDLHTPHVGASKAMPLTTPYCGMPCIAIVFARLLVGGKSHGVKPFLVCLRDACGMRPGVTSRILPTRPGTKPLDHSLTAFNHVDLPFSALLGSSSEEGNDRLDFLRQIWRLSARTLSLSIMGISAIKVGTRIAAVYSERRTITAPDGPVPAEIMSFSTQQRRTQQRPIVEGWVQGKVLHAFARWTIGMCPNLSDATQHALAAIFKATVMKASQILRPLAERCGWQGLCTYNQISELDLTFQGISIAEGGTLVSCIYFMSELLGEKLELPQARNRLSRLAQREDKLMLDMKSRLEMIGGYKEHRGPDFDRHILPRCRLLAEAIGNRMAYEAAETSGLSPDVLTLYERICMREDPNHLPVMGLQGRADAQSQSSEPYDSVLAQIRSESASRSDLDDYVTAPIMSEESWGSFTNGLHAFRHAHDVAIPCSKL
ncbi:peroxisomal acyl-coenzyme A oxidase 3 [Fusarium beomiforme]|uniref:Peroxisomal acyl-coenzyme A oxidase 3 n=1 Tax=Fusarium beomiforme TaxID=44412 RepID=A0A9P5A517_9HYPO|nr:peroxisomal acyl-coenzyme A oxidase 3 [Fusarium beomiforme]